MAVCELQLPVAEEEIENDDSEPCYARRDLVPRVITSTDTARGRWYGVWWQCCRRQWLVRRWGTEVHVSITAVMHRRGTAAAVAAAIVTSTMVTV